MGEHSSPIGHPPAATSPSTSYTFERTQNDGFSPVAYDPCRPIHYVTNPANEPAGAQANVREAVAAASRATGLEFVDDGATTEPYSITRRPYQPNRYPDRWAPVLIAFTAPGQHPASDDLRAIGLGGSAALSVGANGPEYYVTGAVFIDSTWSAKRLRTGHSDDVRAVLEHELGHVLGLNHVHDPTQLMNPSESSGVTTYQAGDRAGLAKLGTGRCAPKL